MSESITDNPKTAIVMYSITIATEISLWTMWCITPQEICAAASESATPT